MHTVHATNTVEQCWVVADPQTKSRVWAMSPSTGCYHPQRVAMLYIMEHCFAINPNHIPNVTTLSLTLKLDFDVCLVSPAGSQTTDHLTLSSSVLSHCLHLPPAVPEDCWKHFLLQISSPSVPGSSSASAALWCPLQCFLVNTVIRSPECLSRPFSLSSS